MNYKVFLSILSLLFILEASGQSVLNDKEIKRGTSVTKDTKVNKGKYGGNQKRYDQIVKRSTRDYYFGNLCVVEVSNKMGFEYVVMPPGINRPSEITNQYFNLKTKLKLCVKYGPWWKLTFKNRVKKCRKLTGDFVG